MFKSNFILSLMLFFVVFKVTAQPGAPLFDYEFGCDTITNERVAVEILNGTKCNCYVLNDGELRARTNKCDNVSFDCSTEEVCGYCCTSNEVDGSGLFFGYSFRINGTDPRYSSYEDFLANDEGFEFTYNENAIFADIGSLTACSENQINTVTYFDGNSDNQITLTFGGCEEVKAQSVTVKNFPESPLAEVQEFCLRGTEPIFDYIDVTEIDQVPYNNASVRVTVEENAFLETIEVSLDNVSFSNQTFDIEFLLDGVSVPIIANNNSGGDITKAAPAQSDFLLDVGIDVFAGQTYVLTFVSNAPPNDLNLLITEADDPLVRNGIFNQTPAVSWYTNQAVTYRDVLYTDGSHRYFDVDGEIDRSAVSSSAEYVDCNFTETTTTELTYTGHLLEKWCYDSNNNGTYDTPAVFRMASDGTFGYLDQMGMTITDVGCCNCGCEAGQSWSFDNPNMTVEYGEFNGSNFMIFGSFNVQPELDEIKACLDNGGTIVATSGANTWTFTSTNVVVDNGNRLTMEFLGEPCAHGIEDTGFFTGVVPQITFTCYE